MQHIRRKELNTRAKPKGATRTIVCKCVHNYYFIDLIDFSSKRDTFVQQCIDENEDIDTRKRNLGYNYVLVCVDGYSRYTMYKLLSSKQPKEVVHAFVDIMNEYGVPNIIVCDHGGEFVSKTFKSRVLNKYNIKMYHGTSENKAVLAERSISSIKQLIRTDFIDSDGVWYSYIKDACDTMNHRINRSTGYTPHDIFINHVIYNEQMEPSDMSTKDITPQYAIGDHVRVCTVRKQLDKASLTYRWSKDVHEVTSIDNAFMPIVYYVSGKNKPYYHWQLLKSQCNVTVHATGTPSVEVSVTPNETVNVTPSTTMNDEHRYNTRGKRYDYTRYR